MDDKEIFFEVDMYINEIAKKGMTNSFYPQMISRKLNIPIELVIVQLMKCVEIGKLILKYEIKCLDDANTIKTVEVIDNDLLNALIECKICGREIAITYSNIYPKFFIDDKFKETLKKKAIIAKEKKFPRQSANDILSLNDLIGKFGNEGRMLQILNVRGDCKMITQTFNGDNNGTINTTESGNITSENTVNKSFDKDDLKDLIQALKKSINETDEFKLDVKDEVIDDLDILEDEVVKNEPSKSRIERILNRVHTTMKSLPGATAGLVTITSNIDKIWDIIKTNF